MGILLQSYSYVERRPSGSTSRTRLFSARAGQQKRAGSWRRSWGPRVALRWLANSRTGLECRARAARPLVWANLAGRNPSRGRGGADGNVPAPTGGGRASASLRLLSQGLQDSPTVSGMPAPAPIEDLPAPWGKLY